MKKQENKCLLTLFLFGEPKLLYGEEPISLLPFPLLIAVYIAVEHKGKIAREQAYQCFYPMQALLPDEYAGTTQELYNQLWEKGLKAVKTGEAINIDHASEVGLEQAHITLSKLGVIKNFYAEKGGWVYQLDDKLNHYLSRINRAKNRRSENSNDGKYDKRTFSSSFAQDISKIRTTIKEIQAQWISDCIPVTPNKESIKLYFPTQVTVLEQAIAQQDAIEIMSLYQGEFIHNIERLPDSRIWISPFILDWIYKKRDYFADKVAKTLLNIVQSSDTQKQLLSSQIEDFCNDIGIENPALIAFLNDEPAPILEEAHTPETKTQPVLPEHFRQWLLNKMARECELQLSLQPHWIEVYASLKALWANYVMPVQGDFALKSDGFIKTLLHKSQGFAVILADGGMGKSLFLYHLTQYMIEKARHQPDAPIPILLHLADQSITTLSFTGWIKQQLNYVGVGVEKTEMYFNALFDCKRCILLLDGFDNIAPQQRPQVLQAINHFIQYEGESELGGVIIASRPQEFQMAQQVSFANINSDYRFFAESQIQPLKPRIIQAYLHKNTLNAQQWVQLLANTSDSGLQQLSQSPLGLQLISNYKQPENLATTPINEIRYTLIDDYVNKKLASKKEPSAYSPKQSKHWLTQLSKLIEVGSTFYIERLSPDMLNDKQHRLYTWVFTLCFGFLFGLFAGGVSGLIFGDRMAGSVTGGVTPELPVLLLPLHYYVAHLVDSHIFIDKLLLMLLYGGFGAVFGLLISSLSQLIFKQLNSALFLSGWLMLFAGWTGYLLDGQNWGIVVVIYYGLVGLIIGSSVDPIHMNANKISLKEAVHWQWQSLFQRQYMQVAALFIPFSVIVIGSFAFFIDNLTWTTAIRHGIIFGIGLGLSYLVYRSRLQQEWDKNLYYPTQKLKLTLVNAIRMVFIIGIGLSFILTLLMLLKLDASGSLSFGLRVGFVVSIILGFLFYGGIEVLKHGVLRWVLVQQNIIPWRYTQFLEYATRDLKLLKVQGTGYAFVHDWFQVYFYKK